MNINKISEVGNVPLSPLQHLAVVISKTAHYMKKIYRIQY